MSNNIVNEVFQEIKKRNMDVGPDSIPHSDEFFKYASGILGIENELIKKIIKILINAHQIFSLKIVQEDTTHDIPEIEGYVVANLFLLRKLKNFFENELVILYEDEYKQRFMVRRVIKEIFPRLNMLNNTQIGEVANKAIMLDEYEGLMEKEYEQYNENWQKSQLKIEIAKAKLPAEIERKGNRSEKGIDKADIDKNIGEKQGKSKTVVSGRAVDSNKYNEFIEKSNNYPIDKILKIYGIDFFLRINLRNYKFTLITELIEKGKIKERPDLIRLKNMLKKIKLNLDKDKKLAKYYNDIYELERVLNHCYYFRR